MTQTDQPPENPGRLKAAGSEARPERAISTRAKIIAGAVLCFERDGVERTTITTIAKELDLSRITIHRAFGDRAGLFEAILHDRFAQIISAMTKHLESFPKLRQALLEGAEFGIVQARADPLLIEIMEKGTGHTLETFLLQNPPEIREMYLEMWRPHFLAARHNGELISSISDDRLIEGMRSIINPILLRTDLDADDRRLFIEDFLFPAIFRYV